MREDLNQLASVDDSISYKIFKYNLYTFKLEKEIRDLKDEYGPELPKIIKGDLLTKKFRIGEILDEIREDDEIFFKGHLSEYIDELVLIFLALKV